MCSLLRFYAVDQATISVLDALISAAFANLLLFPVEYLVPFMITNVNSFSTGTPVPESIVRQQVRRIGRKLFPAVKRSDVNRLLRTGGPKPRRGQNRGVGARTRTAGNRKSPDHEPKSLEISAAGAVASVLSRPGFQRSISDARLVTAYAGEGKTAPSFESAKSMALWTQKSRKIVPITKNNSRGVAKAADLSHLAGAGLVNARRLKFVGCNVSLPKVVVEEEAKATTQTKQAELAQLRGRIAAATIEDRIRWTRVTNIQRKFRERFYERRAIRYTEFEVWRTELQEHRSCLAAITYAFLATLGMFTMMICLLMSAAFNAQECVRWVGSVGESLIVSTFIVDPGVTLVILFLRMLGSWVLLRLDKRHKQTVADVTKTVRDATAAAKNTGDVVALQQAIKLAEKNEVATFAVSQGRKQLHILLHSNKAIPAGTTGMENSELAARRIRHRQEVSVSDLDLANNQRAQVRVVAHARYSDGDVAEALGEDLGLKLQNQQHGGADLSTIQEQHRKRMARRAARGRRHASKQHPSKNGLQKAWSLRKTAVRADKAKREAIRTAEGTIESIRKQGIGGRVLNRVRHRARQQEPAITENVTVDL